MFIYSQLLAKHGVKALFSDREGGSSHVPFDSLNLGFSLGDADADVQHNLELLCKKSDVVIPHQAQQAHGNNVLLCSNEGMLHADEADALVACDSGVAVAVRTADCLPILLVDTQANIAAAVHAGWKGTVAQVVQQTVLNMCGLGAKPERILASLGPCIGVCCFEVNVDIAKQLEESCGVNVSRFESSHIFVDLKRANVRQLLNVGLAKRNIEVLQQCTACHVTPGYFSYRRDKGETGRQLSLVMLP